MTTAVLTALVLSASAAHAVDPLCGDVNKSSSINTTDALLVLRKSVSQPVTLDCSAYGTQFSACETVLDEAKAALSTCGTSLTACLLAPACDGIVGNGKDCEVGDLNNATCETLGFAGGTLACAAGCAFDTSGCFVERFDVSGPTIIDRQTGLEWEKKEAPGDGTPTCPGAGTCSNAHDVDNLYQWSLEASPGIGPGIAPNGPAFTDFLGKLNGATTSSCYAGHCDWRLPTIGEWGTLPWPLDPAFLPSASGYWSATTYENYQSGSAAWFFSSPEDVGRYGKNNVGFVRAVRLRSSAGQTNP